MPTPMLPSVLNLQHSQARVYSPWPAAFKPGTNVWRWKLSIDAACHIASAYLVSHRRSECSRPCRSSWRWRAPQSVHSSMNAFNDAGSGDTPHGLDVVVVTDGGDGAHHKLHGALRVQVRPVGSCQCEQLVLRLMYDAQPSHRYGLLRINGWQGDQQDCRLWPAAIAKALWRAARLLSLLVCRQDVSDWKMHSAPSQAHGLHPWTAAGGHYHCTIDSPTAGVGVPPGRLREVVLEDAQRVGRRAAGAAVQYRRHVDIYGVVGAVRAHLPH